MNENNAHPGPPPLPATAKPERLFTFWSGGWVVLLATILTVAIGAWMLYPVFKTGFQRAVGDGVHLDSYRFDLTNCIIPKEKLQPAGIAKNAIRAISAGEVETMSPTEVKAFQQAKRHKIVVDNDRVIGVQINGEARAYPLRVLVQHEVCNDVVGGKPIAVTYSALCDSAVVFDREVAGQIREFRNSGLLLNCNAVYYDRQSDPKNESLWSQLLFKAVAGPEAGKELRRIDHALTTWGEWKAANPATNAFVGVAAMRDNKKYDEDAYAVYFANDTVPFRAEPLWSDARAAKKLQIVALQEAGKWTVKRRADVPATAGGDRVEAFLFAWYAMYPDADYSAIK